MRPVKGDMRLAAAEARETRRDPAPSRLAYRMNRLMLRPGFRRFLRYGLPILCVATVALVWASDDARVDAAFDRVGELRRQLEERPEFMVHMMAVEHASDETAAQVRSVLAMDFPMSSFDMELSELRRRVRTLDAVAEASVRIRTGGVLEIDVTERQPAAIWRTSEGLTLIDETGHRVTTLDARADRPDLPLLAGPAADKGVAEALELIAAMEPLEGRLRGLLRVGARRWDVILDRDQRILLPEIDPLTALQKAIALDAAQDLFARDIAAVDFRNPRRPAIRLGQGAAEDLYDTDFTPDGEQSR